ncbi:MAG TPA: helix-turn-helix transcriptional regulator [Candidatus Pelethomonas intestinigallinarum]|nr:helix-turn-helix transcriptional regulator [Candidatus Pelethomonas intestinigallinarum]
METRIKAMREDRDLKQKEIAEAIGITQRKYSYLETGVQQWTDELLVRLAAYYGTSVDYLLGLTDNPDPYRKSRSKEK